MDFPFPPLFNQIVERWLPWQDSEGETIRLENHWNQQSLDC